MDPEGEQMPQDREANSEYNFIENIVRALRLPSTRSPFCRHSQSCIASVLTNASKVFGATYFIKALMGTLFALKKILVNPMLIFSSFKSLNSVRFGLFIGVFVLIFKGLYCLLRRVIKEENHKYIPLFAGFIGGIIAVLFLQKKSRQTFALFLLARAIDMSYQSLVKKGFLPEFKYYYVALYSLMMGITGYVFGTEPGSMSPEMNKFYLTFTKESVRDMQMREIWIERKNNYLESLGKGIARQNPLDYMPKLKKYYESVGRQPHY